MSYDNTTKSGTCNAVTQAAMDDAEKGEDMHGPYDSVDDLMKALNT